MIYTLKKEIQGDDLADGYKVVMLKNECWQYIIYIKSIAHNNMICRRKKKKKKKRFITTNTMEGHNFNRRGCIATLNC